MRPLLILMTIMTSATLAYGRGEFSDEQRALTPASAALEVFDISGGKTKARLKLDNQSISAPAYAGETVYVATSDKKVLALDSKTGRSKWQYAATHPVFSLLATTKDLYIGAGGTLLSLDPANGNVRWSFDNDMAMMDPAIADGLIVFNTIDGPVALEPSTGKTRWRLNVQWGYFIFSPLSDHRVCVWKPDEIYVIDTENGKTLWQSSADNSVSAPGALPSPAVAAADAICQLRGSRTDPRDWSLFTLDAGSGRILWKTNLGDFHGAAARTLIAGKRVYCILDETVFALDMNTGEKKWQASTKPLETYGSGMMASAGCLFLPQVGGSILALDAKTGQRKWLAESTAPSRKNTMRTAGIAVVGDSIFVARNELMAP